MNEQRIDNALVRVKDTLLHRLNDAIAVESLEGIGYVVEFLGDNVELWVEVNYTYKAREILNRIIDALQSMSESNTNTVAGRMRAALQEKRQTIRRQAQAVLADYNNRASEVEREKRRAA